MLQLAQSNEFDPVKEQPLLRYARVVPRVRASALTGEWNIASRWIYVTKSASESRSPLAHATLFFIPISTFFSPQRNKYGLLFILIHLPCLLMIPQISLSYHNKELRLSTRVMRMNVFLLRKNEVIKTVNHWCRWKKGNSTDMACVWIMTFHVDK